MSHTTTVYYRHPSDHTDEKPSEIAYIHHNSDMSGDARIDWDHRSGRKSVTLPCAILQAMIKQAVSEAADEVRDALDRMMRGML